MKEEPNEAFKAAFKDIPKPGYSERYGGKRAGAGRPRKETVAKVYKLDPSVIAKIKEVASHIKQPQSAVANQMLNERLKQLKGRVWYFKSPHCSPNPLQRAAARAMLQDI